MARKRLVTGGRNASRHSTTTLTDMDVMHIRRLYDTESLTVREIADHYHLGEETIRRIGRRSSFRWLAESATPEDIDIAAKESTKKFAEIIQQEQTKDLQEPYPPEQWTEEEIMTAKIGFPPSKAKYTYRWDGTQFIQVK